MRAEAATVVRAPPDRVRALYLDFAHWPALFPATIAGTRLLRREGDALAVEVQHRTEGRVLNRLRPCGPDAVELWESKRRYEATFLNRFDADAAGTRYTVVAAVRLRWPYALLGPLLRPVVRRALRRSVLAPVRAAAERDAGRWGAGRSTCVRRHARTRRAAGATGGRSRPAPAGRATP